MRRLPKEVCLVRGDLIDHECQFGGPSLIAEQVIAILLKAQHAEVAEPLMQTPLEHDLFDGRDIYSHFVMNETAEFGKELSRHLYPMIIMVLSR